MSKVIKFDMPFDLFPIIRNRTVMLTPIDESDFPYPEELLKTKSGIFLMHQGVEQHDWISNLYEIRALGPNVEEAVDPQNDKIYVGKDLKVGQWVFARNVLMETLYGQQIAFVEPWSSCIIAIVKQAEENPKDFRNRIIEAIKNRNELDLKKNNGTN